MHKIAHNVKMPGKSKYGFDRMAIGDSFKIEEPAIMLNKVRSSAYMWGAKYQMKFTIRYLPERSSYWCWRWA